MRWRKILGRGPGAPLLLVCATVTLAAGCNDGGRTYQATIVRTDYGIPHITADNWGDLGFGAGYAYAQDNFCVLMREVIRAEGQSTRWFGESEGDIAADYVYTYINTDEYIQNKFIDAAPPELQDLVRGYAAGLDQYLKDTGVDGLPAGEAGCQGEPWVRPITPIDLGKVYRKLIVGASTDVLTSFIVAAQPPAMASMTRQPVRESTPWNFAALGLPKPEVMGSNAYGIGADASQTGKGIVLGNPHFPWTGPRRWYIQHLTVPGEYDVMGASLQGVPLINIGFNRDLAWSHTVSTGQRFTFYSLDLVDGDPMSYHYGNEIRHIVPHDVTIQVMTASGTIESRTHTIYTSHFGPIVDLGAVNAFVGGWPTFDGRVFTFRDANIDNTRAIEQFLRIGQSHSIDELVQALTLEGLPWVNTIAADRNGDALYADMSVVPGVRADQLAACTNDPVLQLLNQAGVTALDGSTPDCEWITGPNAPDGLLGPSELPVLKTRSYVANSNDSYWLSNPDNLLTGFSPLIGKEGVAQSLRTRLGFVQIEDRLAGTDGLGAPGFTVDLVKQVMYGNRDIAQEMVRPDVLTICDAVTDWSAGDCDGAGAPYSANPTQAAGVCNILRSWDGRYNVDSVGAGLWNEFWRLVRNTDNLWAVPFDATDPVHTPSGLNSSDPAVAEAVRCALGGAVDFFINGNVAFGQPWGQLQFRPVGTDRIPLHGGSGRSTFSVIGSNFVDGEGYSDIVAGNSYIQAVTWTDDPDCPDAYSVLTYSQSSYPSSPYYADQTQLYSDKGWNDVPYCPADVQAQTVSTTTVSNR